MEITSRLRTVPRWPLVVLVFVLAVLIVYAYPPTHAHFIVASPQAILGVDFKGVFRPAALAVVTGQSPYNGWAYNPPWLYWMLLPIAVLPEALGTAVMFVTGFATFAFVAYRLGGHPVSIVLILIAPPVIYSATNGNIDGIAALGLVMPPQIGLFFIMLKPQVCIGAAIFWMADAFRKGGIKQVIRISLPVTVALLASFVLYGLWPLTGIDPVNHPWNMDAWPWGIPIGIALLIYAIRSHDIAPSAAASPFLSPYVSVLSWSAVLLAFIRRPIVTGLLVVIMWVIYALDHRLAELFGFLFG